MRSILLHKIKNGSCLLLLGMFFVLLSQTSAFAAAANEYYVWNGFGPVSSAFEKIALIFSDNGYLVFFSCFAAMSMVFGAASAYGKMLGGGGSNGAYMSWMIPVFFGTGVYLSMIVPKTHIEIYDPVLNQHLSVSGVPVGIVYTATMLNHVERALVDIVNTSAPPGRDYTLTAGGVGIDLLSKTVTSTISDTAASRTMSNYVQDCVMFELVRPGTTLTLDSLIVTSGGATILDAMSQAKNPAVYTVNYLDNTVGAPGTCQDVYVELKDYFSSVSNLSGALSNACGAAGIDVGDASAIARCQSLIADAASNTFGAALSYSDVIANANIAMITADYLKSASTEVATEFAAAKNIAQSGAGEGFTSVFNTISRAAFTAFVIALVPLIALFIPTPFCKSALAMIFGLFVWVIVWNVCELVIHHFFMDYYYRTITSVTNSGFGIQAMLDIPSYNSVAMGTFGKLKAGAAGFATVVTGGIFKFGGSEMSHFAGRMGQAVSGSQGSMTGSEGRAGALNEHMHKQEQVSMARMTAPWTNQGAVGMDQLADGKSARQIGMAGNGAGQLGFGGNGQNVFDNAGLAGRNETAEKFGKAANMTTAQAIQSGQVNAATIAGNLEGYGNNPAVAAKANAFVDTMRKSGDATQYSAMVGDYAKKSGIDMSTEAGKNQAYGEFAALNLASNKAIMEAFSDKDSNGQVKPGSAVKNYQDFQEQHHGKSRGQMEGETAAFTNAKESGFSGGWKDYHAMQSQMSSLNGYANADAWQKIANNDHYKGDTLKMLSDVQKVQNSQGAGNASGVLKQAQSAMDEGVKSTLEKAGVGPKGVAEAQKAYRLHGQTGMQESLAKSEWGQQNPDKVAEVAGSAHKAAVSQGVFATSGASGEINQLSALGKADGFWSTTNANDVRTGASNEFLKSLGTNVDAVAMAMEGSGLNARQAVALTAGTQGLDQIANAQMQQTAAQTLLGGHDPKTMMEELKSKNGVMSGVLNKAGAAALHKKFPKAGFTAGDKVSMGVGADGSISVANGERGGYKMNKKGKSEELWNNKLKNTGSVDESRKIKNSGSQDKEYSENQKIGNIKMSDGKTYTGTINYGKKDDGTPYIVSGSGTTLQEYSTDSQFTAPDGKSAPTKTSGSYSQDGKLLTSDSKGGERTSIDSTKSFGGGYVYNNTVSASLDQAGYTRAAQASGRVQGALTDVTKYVAPVKSAMSSMKPGPEAAQAEREAAREAEQSAREATRKAEQQTRDSAAESARRLAESKAKTSTTLRNQSRTSNLPKSNGPAPAKNLNRGGTTKPNPSKGGKSGEINI